MTSDHAAQMARIEERLRLGLPVTQEDWDKAAGQFDDTDEEELVPPDPEPVRPAPAGLARLIREAFDDLEHEKKPKK